MKNTNFIIISLFVISTSLFGAFHRRPTALLARLQTFNSLRVQLSPITPRPLLLRQMPVRSYFQSSSQLILHPQLRRLFSSQQEPPKNSLPEEWESYVNSLSLKDLEDYINTLPLDSKERDAALKVRIMHPDYNPDPEDVSPKEVREMQDRIILERMQEAAQELYASRKEEIERLKLNDHGQAAWDRQHNRNHWQSNLINDWVLTDITFKAYSDAFKEYIASIYGQYNKDTVKAFLKKNNLPEPSGQKTARELYQALPAWIEWAQKNMPNEIYEKTAPISQDIQKIIEKRDELIQKTRLNIKTVPANRFTNSAENIMFFWLHSLEIHPPAKKLTTLQSIQAGFKSIQQGFNRLLWKPNSND